MPWIDNTPPQPVTKFKRKGKKVKWEVAPAQNEMDRPVKFLIYVNLPGQLLNTEDPGNFIPLISGNEYQFERFNKKKKKYEVRISVLDRLNNESVLSKPVIVKL